jgi:predicted Zn-dependent peptidase
MKKIYKAMFVFLSGTSLLLAQQVEFQEYNLENGLHVILHQDRTAPVVTTSVMYNVGGKDRTEGRTGFAHFFEHLLFEGSENIGRGEFMKIVSSRGGRLNANTSQDRTYYYEVLPSNQVELGLWLESERMFHPVIDTVGVNTQNEVVKEEKRLRVDNAPYGKFLTAVESNLFKVHPYKDPNIGYMKDLDAATLEEFIAYKNKYYHPNNAVLVVAGDIDVNVIKKKIDEYFSPIPSGPKVERNFPEEEPIVEEVRTSTTDDNIQIPAMITAYRTPGFAERDAYVLDMISTYLSDGQSSKLYKRMVDENKQALQVGAINLTYMDYGLYVIFSLPVGDTSLDTLVAEVSDEVQKLRTNLISERDHQKLLNIFENNFVNANSSVEGIANSLARYYLLYGDTNLINEQINIYRSITREEIKAVAEKYLKDNQRVVIDYIPTPSKTE